MDKDFEKIDIALIDMKHQKITDVYYADIELHDEFLKYRGKFSCEETKDAEDSLLGTQDSEYEWETMVKRASVASIDFDLGTPTDYDKHWSVTVVVAGRPSDLHIYFAEGDRANARKLYEKLVDWFMK